MKEGDVVSNEDIRLRCLELAKEVSSSYDDMMQKAKEMLEFIYPTKPS